LLPVKTDTLEAKKSYNKTYAVWCFIGLFLVMALKSPEVGTDWTEYLRRYDNYATMSYREIYNKADEFLYYWTTKFLHDLGVGHQGFIALIGFFVSLVTAYFVYKETQDVFLAMFLHLTIGNFTMTMSGVRQTIAICMIMIAYFCVKKNKLIPFLLWVFTASFFHTSAIIFIPFYWILKIRLKFRSCLCIWLGTLALIPFRNSLTNIIEKIQPERYERYDLITNEHPVNPLVVLVAFLIPIACLLVNEIMVKKEDKYNLDFSRLYILSCVYAFSAVLSLNSIILVRLGYYFVTFNIILLPMVINNIQKVADRKLAYFAAIVLPAIQFIISTPGGALKIDEYKFFWQ